MQSAQPESTNKTAKPSLHDIGYYSRHYNERMCPFCGEHIFGMPGGRDAFCSVCGYKDPCCSD